MARQLRIEYAGALYHVMARGDRREDIFVTDQDRQMFLDTLQEACGMTGWRVHAWVLMRNHYHWVLETPEPNLVAGMKWFQNTYTRRFNSRHRLWGHVFGDRYKSIPVEQGDYFNRLVDYVHLNPVRAGLSGSKTPADLLSHPWSSLSRVYAVAPSKRPGWCAAGRRLEVEEGEDQAADRRRYLRQLLTMAREEGRKAGKVAPMEPHGHSPWERGWYWGGEAFCERLLRRVDRARLRNANYRSSAQSRDKGRKTAEELIAGGLRRVRLSARDLARSKGSHPAKVAIALALKAATTQGNPWIAQRLCMRSAANVSQLCRRHRLGTLILPGDLQRWLQSVKNL